MLGYFTKIALRRTVTPPTR